MKQAIRSLTLFGMFALAAGCDSAPAADDKAKTADKALASDTPPAPASDVAAQPAADDKASPPPATPTTPTAGAGKSGDGDRTAAVATRGPDRVKDAEAKTAEAKPDAQPTDSKVAPAAPAADAEDGGSLVQKEGWANYAKELQAKASAVNKSCGSKLSSSYDKSTYTDFDPMKDRTQAACEAAVGAMQSICATEEGKAAVQKLNKTVCKFSTSGTGVQKSGTTLVVKIDPANSSISGKEPGGYSWISAIKEVL